MEKLNRWLEQFDPLPLECDGMTRVISTLLQREAIEHAICIGRLEVAGVGATPLHWWIAFPDGSLCDLRARMWLQQSSKAPHGAFTPEPHQNYVESTRVAPDAYRLDSFVFMVLAEKPMAAFTLLNTPAPSSNAPGF